MKRGALALLCALLLPACAAAAEEAPVRLVSEIPCIEEALRSEPLGLDPDALVEQYQWLDAASAVHPVCEALTDEKTGKLCLRLTGGIDYAYFPEATLSVSGVGRLSFTYDAERDLFVCDKNASDEALSKLEQALKGEADSAGVSLNYAGDLHSRATGNKVVGCHFGIDPREGGIRSQFMLRYLDGEKTTHVYSWRPSQAMLDYSKDGSPLRMQFFDGVLRSYKMTFNGMDGDITYTISYDANGEVYGPDREGYEEVHPQSEARVLYEEDGKSSYFSYTWNFDEQIWEYFDNDKRVWQPASEETPGGGKLLSPYDERLASPYDVLYPEKTTPAPESTPDPMIEPEATSRPKFVFGS